MVLQRAKKNRWKCRKFTFSSDKPSNFFLLCAELVEKPPKRGVAGGSTNAFSAFPTLFHHHPTTIYHLAPSCFLFISLCLCLQFVFQWLCNWVKSFVLISLVFFFFGRNFNKNKVLTAAESIRTEIRAIILLCIVCPRKIPPHSWLNYMTWAS